MTGSICANTDSKNQEFKFRCILKADLLSWELTAPWTGVQVKVPVKFIVGDLDLVYSIPGIKEYIHNGGFQRDVPLLEEVVVMEGVTHFINLEKPEEISKHIHEFIKKF
ncbi:alpha/beta-Hydrolases superfamily protein [Actinidia rufa]|uniref:Alpha/beta-Hydrolases superfamily protein n=1 Tax=Actinidia rufa TaxID=165716 RepID=A0A7J0GT26_9ERIC|nr:alpha/beta-Hydrolases superfamily protein [Actinidia rufa]